MRVLGADFTSTPKGSKKIVVADGDLEAEALHVSTHHDIATLEQFARLLNEPGPWVIAIDFPFGLPARLVEKSGWQDSWLGYVSDCAAMGKQRFVEYLRNYRHPVTGERRLFRETDRLAGSRSPMQVDFTPVGRMFFVGARILAESSCTVVPFRAGPADVGVVVEGYPKLVAVKAVGSDPYKSERPSRTRPAETRVRQGILDWLSSDEISRHYGFTVLVESAVTRDCRDDVRGDTLDAVLCAVQAGWAWRKRRGRYGVPSLGHNVEDLEGWIVDPHTLGRHLQRPT